MKNQRFAVLISVFNLIVILFIAARPNQENFEKIRVKEFELVDTKGIIRASFKVEPDGEMMMRLKDQSGNIRVKLGASDEGSGLVLLNGATALGIQALAKNKGTTLVLVDKDGKKREL